MMKRYQWLYFDLDNTLLDFAAASKHAFYDAFDKHRIELTPSDYEKYNEINHQVWIDFEKGLLTSEVLKIRRWKLFMQELDLDLDPQVINAAYFDHLAYNPIYVEGAKELISQLSQNYKLALITNGLPEVQIPRLRLTGLDKCFDPIVISDVIGVAKPAAAFYDYVQEKSGHPMKDQVLVIGDSLTSDIRGGINYGFDTCWFNYNGIENKTEYHATYMISKISELDDILMS